MTQVHELHAGETINMDEQTPVDLPDEPQDDVSSAETPDKAVAVVSGGMDSVAMLYELHRKTKDILVVSFDYGQQHRNRELPLANMHAQVLGLPHYVVGMEHLGSIFVHAGSESSLINPDVDVPDGHYAEESMKSTVVPNRNMIMASIAAGIAVSAKANILGLGVHSGDHFIYPDCRPEFFYYLEHALQLGNEGFGHPKPMELFTPWMHRTKTDIVRQAHIWDVPLQFTWSCYKGNEVHCGTCGTCVERKEAFEQAGVEDKTIYASTPEFTAP